MESPESGLEERPHPSSVAESCHRMIQEHRASQRGWVCVGGWEGGAHGVDQSPSKAAAVNGRRARIFRKCGALSQDIGENPEGEEGEE